MRFILNVFVFLKSENWTIPLDYSPIHFDFKSSYISYILTFNLCFQHQRQIFLLCCLRNLLWFFFSIYYTISYKKVQKKIIFPGFFADGWTTNDLVYMWKTGGSPVQLTANLSLPGGFKLDNHTSLKCDVVTATGNIFLQKILKLQWVLYNRGLAV